MKPYRIIKGTDFNIEKFETAVSDALEQGYELSSPLITKVISTTGGESEVIFLQPVVYEELIDIEEDMLGFEEEEILADSH